MKAIIFAAGHGTRLKSLTADKPKALVEIDGKPLLYYAIQNLLNAGVSEIIVNVHHFADKIVKYIKQNNFPVKISDERNFLLETGGGLKKASGLLQGEEPIIACNVDVMYNLSLEKLIKYHLQHQALATLVVRKRETSRYLLFDDENQLCGWQNISSGEIKISKSGTTNTKAFAFSGIQIISPNLLDLLHEEGKFSIIQPYLRLSKDYKILAYIDKSDFWLDVGKPEQLIKAEEYVLKNGYPA